MRTAISAAIIRNKKILLVEKKETWILPGGKPEPCDEGSSLNCLHREVEEELPRIKMINIYYYKDFQGITPYTGDTLEARVYFVDIKGDERITGEEISKSKWMLYSEMPKYKLSDITQKIIDSLKKDEYL